MKAKFAFMFLVFSGSLILLIPTNNASFKWVSENLQTESWQNDGFSIAIEPRYFSSIMDGIIEDGFTIKPD
jgi:hypothetical protein